MFSAYQYSVRRAIYSKCDRKTLHENGTHSSSACIQHVQFVHNSAIQVNTSYRSIHTLIRSDFHLSESQRVVLTLPASPHHADTVFSVAAQVEPVQVGRMTVRVPPGTFESHCTWLWSSPFVVVLIWSAVLRSKYRVKRVTFNQQVNTC